MLQVSVCWGRKKADSRTTHLVYTRAFPHPTPPRGLLCVAWAVTTVQHSKTYALLLPLYSKTWQNPTLLSLLRTLRLPTWQTQGSNCSKLIKPQEAFFEHDLHTARVTKVAPVCPSRSIFFTSQRTIR